MPLCNLPVPLATKLLFVSFCGTTEDVNVIFQLVFVFVFLLYTHVHAWMQTLEVPSVH